MPMILIEGGRKKGSFNLHVTGLQEAPLVISLISAVTHSRAPQFVISGILCRPPPPPKKKKKRKRKLKPQQQEENLLWQMRAQRHNSDVTSVAAVCACAEGAFLWGWGCSGDLHSARLGPHPSALLPQLLFPGIFHPSG